MRLTVLFVSIALLGGCAHVPDTSVYYFPSRTAVNLKVTRLLACSNDNQVFSSQTVTATAINSADLSAQPIPLDLGLLNSTFANTSFTAEFLEDGRLKGINVSETGKAGDIIKSAASLVKLVLPGIGAVESASRQFPKLCAMIAKEQDKIVTLKYEITLEPTAETRPGTSWSVPLTSDSQHFLLSALTAGAEVAPLELKISVAGVAKPAVPAQTGGDDGVWFRYPADATLVLATADMPLWSDSLPISQLGASGWLPIARAPAFGKTTTEIALNPDGSLSKVVYGSETGTQAATDAASEVVGVVDGQSDAERTAAAEAEQKRIKAERALLRCQAEPSTC